MKVTAAPTACLIVDIGDFKKFNNDYGHPKGDEVLKAVVGPLLAAARGKGRAYRYGGDEFGVLLPNHTAEEARAIAERIRKDVSATKVAGVDAPITVAIGVASVSATTSGDELLRQADAALLQAKKAGKNQTVVYGFPAPRRTPGGTNG